MTAGWAIPAYVPRCSAGHVRVTQGQAADVRLVDDRLVVGVRGARSSPQSKNGLMTTFVGMYGALSTVFSAAGSLKR